MKSAERHLAFERLLRPHLDRLYRLAFRLTAGKAEADDLLQELLLKAWGKLDDIAAIDQPGPWLARVMYNLFIDERRRFARHRLRVVEAGALAGDGIEGLPGGNDPVAEHTRQQRFEQLERALAQLGEEPRIIVLLHDTEGYKLSEIQELMGLPLGTVKSRLHRARARLKELLSADGTFSAS